jgi:hypothetical protein
MLISHPLFILPADCSMALKSLSDRPLLCRPRTSCRLEMSTVCAGCLWAAAALKASVRTATSFVSNLSDGVEATEAFVRISIPTPNTNSARRRESPVASWFQVALLFENRLDGDHTHPESAS